MPTPTGYTLNYTAAQTDEVVRQNTPVEIPENADLNTYTTPGIYLSPSNTVTNSLSHCPVFGGEFRLEVRLIDGTDSILEQKIILKSSRPEVIYARIYYSSSFRDWICRTVITGTALVRTSLTSGYYLNSAGTEVSGSNYQIVTYNVSGITALRFIARLGAVAYAHFYDSGGNIISGHSIGGNSESGYNINMSIDVPTNAVTFKTSCPTSYNIAIYPLPNISEFYNDEGYIKGTNVATVYSGSSAPSSATGNDGDIYIQTS